MSQPVLLADLLPAALAAFRAPHLARVPRPEGPSAPLAADHDAVPRIGLSQVLVRVDAVLRRAA